MFENYLMFMCCVLVTLVAILIIAAVVRLTWDEVIKPIRKDLHHKEEVYWRGEFDKINDRFYKIWPRLLIPSFIDRHVIDIPPIHEFTKEPDEKGYRYLMIKIAVKEEE